MKQYPKSYDEISMRLKDSLSKIGSVCGSSDNLAGLFRTFYKEAHPLLFSMIVKEVWLERRCTYNGVRRSKRKGNGATVDGAFSKFLKSRTGATQKFLTTGFGFTVVASYLPDFFPKFDDFDPFTDEEYFKFPYKNIFLDHLVFVSQVHNRVEMLAYAEETSMTIYDFENWAYNWVMSHNQEVGYEMYGIDRRRKSWVPIILRLK